MSFRPGLQSLIFIGCLVVTLGVLAVLSPLLTQGIEERQIELVKAELQKNLALAGKLYIQRNPAQTANLNEFTGDLARTLHARISVFSSQGRVLGESSDSPTPMTSADNPASHPEFMAALADGQGFDIRIDPAQNGKALYAAQLVRGGDGFSAVLRASLPLARITDSVFQINELVMIALVVGAVLSLAASILIYRAIKQPVGDLARTAQAIAGGDLFRRIRRYPHHEIGELVQIFNAMADTIQEKIENVTEARDHLEAILKGMAEGVLVTDAQGRILFANKALRNLLDLERDPAGSMPSEIIRNADLVSAMRQIRHGTPRLFRQIRTLGTNPRHLEARVVRISQQDGPAGCVAVLRDNTEQIRTEQIRRDFVANVSHELRTPLTAIQGAAEVLLGGALNSPEDANRFVEMIQRQSSRLKQLSQDLLDLSIIESGRKKTHAGPVMASELAEDILSTMSEVAIKHEVQLEARLHEENLQFQADQSQVEEALINLVDNAIKYSGQGGRVILSMQAVKDEIWLSVEDDGPGIEPEHLPRLFERFYRVDNNRSRQMGGTGLGLAIVKHLAQAQGGRVEVKSQPGEGSTFTIIIPKAERPEPK